MDSRAEAGATRMWPGSGQMGQKPARSAQNPQREAPEPGGIAPQSIAIDNHRLSMVMARRSRPSASCVGANRLRKQLLFSTRYACFDNVGEPNEITLIYPLYGGILTSWRNGDRPTISRPSSWRSNRSTRSP
ncbi:hypothetical protein MPC4_330013 [Methylocella tundrae]|uniref:Uncharacterized protein n=1 Tax=Methylocella tundrae TaxID=227605 RepID=A0A8B6M855_METTU|nr:hypothetical protein MPC4_330013 [Methylocella tundrae]